MRIIQRDIVGALLFSNDNHLLLGQTTVGGVYPDSWVMPGGGHEEGESLLEAMKRELIEEVGIDVNQGIITLLDEVMSGESEKTLRETGERVIVEMKFYNYRVDIDKPASELPIILEDDLGVAEWIPLPELHRKKFAPSVEALLKKMGYLQSSTKDLS